MNPVVASLLGHAHVYRGLAEFSILPLGGRLWCFILTRHTLRFSSTFASHPYADPCAGLVG